MVWVVIESVTFLLTLPFFRTKISKQEVKLWRRSINRIERKSEKIWKVVKEIILCIAMSMIIFAILMYVFHSVIQYMVDWCNGVFIVAFFPIFISWIQNSENKMGSKLLDIINIFLGITLSILIYVADSTNNINMYKEVIIMIFSIFVSVGIISIGITLVNTKYILSTKKIKKGIRKDLYFRTSNLDINFLQIELIRHSECFFSEYLFYLKKMKNVMRIEYVTLRAFYKDYWYTRTVKYMRYFIILNMLIVLIDLLFNRVSLEIILLCSLITSFILNIMYLKKKDNNYLYLLAIRYFFDEWGYCIYCNDKNPMYVGTVQMIELQKQHKFIHSFLDIVSICRAVALDDYIMKTDKIKLLSKNISELLYVYADDDYSKVCRPWIVYLPLWVSSIFEYKIFGNIDTKIKHQLRSILKSDKDWKDLCIFFFFTEFCC